MLAWLTVPLITGAVLIWREAGYRTELARAVPATLAPADSLPVVREAPLPTAALAPAFGLRSSSGRVVTQEQLKLKASFVPSQGEARALIASGAEQRMYSVGDLLPGGAVLRRIDSSAIDIWINGREETLPLLAIARRSLLPLGSLEQAAQAPATSLRLLQEVQ